MLQHVLSTRKKSCTKRLRKRKPELFARMTLELETLLASTRERLTREEPEERRTCPVCAKVLPTRPALLQHILKQRRQTTTASSCVEALTTAQAQAVRQEWEDTGYRCPVCDQWFPTQRGMLAHTIQKKACSQALGSAQVKVMRQKWRQAELAHE